MLPVFGSSDLSQPVQASFIQSEEVFYRSHITMFIVTPISCGGLCFVLVLLYSTLCHPSVTSTLMGKRAGCFTLIVFLVSCDR